MALSLEGQTFDAQQEGWVIQMGQDGLALPPKRQSSIDASIDHRLLTAGGRIANPRTNNVQDTTSVRPDHPQHAVKCLRPRLSRHSDSDAASCLLFNLSTFQLCNCLTLTASATVDGCWNRLA
ncbi:hypothetical protein BKA70DRAFT_1450515 [Coprinopsis sp. MPI-PUGE-AT-0042]|nr:hypothetical protein BKA70DRAFT_1450515 [Coprinopsis sp. MPI-PUGE-AT-0042]